MKRIAVDTENFFNILMTAILTGDGNEPINLKTFLNSNTTKIASIASKYEGKPTTIKHELFGLIDKLVSDQPNPKTASQKENTMQTNSGTEMDVRTLVQQIKEHPEVLKSIPDDELVNFLTQHAGAKASLTKAVAELEKGEGEIPGTPETSEPNEVTPEDAQSLEGNPAVSQKPVTASDLYPATDTKHENINKMYDSREVDRTKDQIDGRDILPGNLHAQVQEAFYSHGRVDEAQLSPKEANELSGLFE
jgi:hypothetical protein